MSIPALKNENTPNNAKKQQPTENQKTTKYQSVNLNGPSFYIYLGGRIPMPTLQLRHCPCLRTQLLRTTHKSFKVFKWFRCLFFKWSKEENSDSLEYVVAKGTRADRAL